MDFLLLPENVEQLQYVLLYHVLTGAVPSSAIVPGPVQTLNGLAVELAVSDDGAITVNDANVSAADVSASNGIVHVIDKVLMPPANGTTASTTADPAAEMCSFCPGGLPNPDLVLPTPDADTCQDASDYALGLAADNSECDYVKGAEAMCCPASSVATTTAAPAGTVDAGAAADIVAVDPTEAVVAVDPTEAAPAEPAMSLPAAVTIDPAASMPADALFGGKSGKGSKSKAMKKAPKSAKALPVKDAKAEKVNSMKTKAAKTEAAPARR